LKENSFSSSIFFLLRRLCVVDQLMSARLYKSTTKIQ